MNDKRGPEVRYPATDPDGDDFDMLVLAPMGEGVELHVFNGLVSLSAEHLRWLRDTGADAALRMIGADE